jgi:hypothetical protein
MNRGVQIPTIRRRTIGALIVVLAGLAVLPLGSCGLMGILSGDEGGELLVSFVSPMARTIAPSLDMIPASYLVSGSGPSGKTFSITTTKASVSKSSLQAGTWVVSVNARNASGTVIGTGSGNSQIAGTGRTSLVVTISPPAGNGTLDVIVTWNAASVPAAVVAGQLQASSGPPIPLSFSMGAGTAASSTGGIPAGYYTLNLQLLSNGANLYGAADAARIVQGQTTSGSYDFTSAATAGGSLSLGVATTDTTPLAVTLGGQLSTLAVGASMTVGASVAPYTGDVAFEWFLNGSLLAVGSASSPSLTFGSNLAAGVYRLDTVAFTTDGLRAGASACTFTIQ